MITNILLLVILIVVCFIALELYAIGEHLSEKEKENEKTDEQI